MFAKFFKASCLLFAAFLITSSPPAHANDQNLFVYYGCDSEHNRVTVKTFVADRKPWKAGKDDLYFLWADGLGMPLECSFMNGDVVYIKSYYGDSWAYGGYRHVAISINHSQLEQKLEFDPDHTQAVRIRSGDNHRVDVVYSKK